MNCIKVVLEEKEIKKTCIAEKIFEIANILSVDVKDLLISKPQYK